MNIANRRWLAGLWDGLQCFSVHKFPYPYVANGQYDNENDNNDHNFRFHELVLFLELHSEARSALHVRGSFF